MKRSDLDLIAEAYDVVNEGLFDRLKARGAQAVGAVKGAGQQLAGKAQQVAGGVVSKAAELGGKAVGADVSQGALAQKGAAMQKAGQKQQTQGARQAEESKYKSYVSNSAKTIINDLEKLGMNVDDAAALEQEIQDVVKKHLTQVTARGQLRDAGGKIGSKI